MNNIFRPESAGEKKDLGEEPSSFSELFHGFLSIGTLGTDPIIVDPSTPISSISVEKLADERTEVTESELRLINEELVKVLGADRNDGSNDSSVTDRNSHATAGRRNQESTIGLIGKPMEGAESSMKEPIICPLQGYLLSAEMGVPDTTVSKKEKRTSLGELFQKTKVAEENSGFSYEKTEKESDKSGMKFMKRLLKKKMIHDSSRSSTSSKGNSDSAKAYKKRPKILRMFHRKVHPEISVELDKLQVNGMKNIMNEGINSDRDQMNPDITICPQRVLYRNGTGPCKSRSNLPQGTDASDSQGNREHWIKTDTNYLVLEL
nr:PREDICTED: uncharacterized protein LOC108194734 [Daucus carota subsp. sativus]